MSREPETRPIAAIFLGARIPFEHVGTVLRLLYSINADGFEIAPHFDDQLPLPETLPVLKTLPLPDRSKAPRKKRSAVIVKPGSLVEFILKQLRHKPKSLAKLRALVLKAGKTLASVQPRLHDLHKRGLIKRLPDGAYLATGATGTTPAKSATPPRKSSSPSRINLVLSHLKHAHPNAVPLRTLRALLAKRGDRHINAASAAIHILKKKGLVVPAAEPATYLYQPPKEPADAR